MVSADTTDMPHKLLLADDSVTIQRVIELTFADEDVRVVAVSDGDQAIAQIDADPPDIVLADVGMPGRDGYEVAAHVKRTPQLAHIPVLLLTGAFEPVDEARASAIGCDGVLAKPFEPQLVISRVKELLGRAGRSQAVASPAPQGSPQARAQTVSQAPAEPPIAPPLEQPSSSPGRLGDYFDRLDAAFAGLSGGAPAQVPPTSSTPPSIGDQIEWFASDSASPAFDLPLLPTPSPGNSEPASALDAVPMLPPIEATIPPVAPAWAPPVVQPPVVSPPAAPGAPAPGEPAARSRQTPMPSLADAFAAILAAEQAEATPSGVPSWPATDGTQVVVTDDLVEQVTRRVLERLPDRVVRETISEIVSAIAERLVREEIERIKSSIK